jgi:hypothetical protein
MINQNMEVTMATQFEKPEQAPQPASGFLRFPPPPVWICPNPPAPPFEFFDIHRPHFYVIHGVPMAFAGEVR